ncbi:MAG TPA: ABC transporter substrate-binding protein [Burkholderiales bacterium]|nr:ABC transporter substrate-binding protein [Burkholderiales bacterium]
MKRRQFLKSTAAIAGTAGLGLPQQGFSQAPEVIHVGHLVGICMSPLFYAQATGMFAAEGLKVEMKFMPNPGDALTALTGGVMQVVHIPFTNIIVAANNGAPVRIIGGSGAGGLFLIAQSASGIKSMEDLKKHRGKGLKVGAMRLNTFELMAYRALANAGLKYEDFNMVWFNDTLSMASAFEAKAVDVVTHVEPFATRLVDKLGGVPIASNLDTWGKDGPDCVTNARVDFLEKHPQAATRYLRALLKADAEIKKNRDKAVEVLDASKFYRVDKDTLRAALPRQMPQVNLIGAGETGMRTAIDDMRTLGYIKNVPANLIDFRFLKEAMKA